MGFELRLTRVQYDKVGVDHADPPLDKLRRGESRSILLSLGCVQHICYAHMH